MTDIDALAPPGTFRRYVWDSLSSPRTLRGHFGRRFMGAIGLLYDATVEAVSEAAKAGWIYENPPPDAISAIGREALLWRYPNEISPESYKARVKRTWKDWTAAGDESSIIGQLTTAGHPGAVIYRWTPISWSEFVVFFPFGTHNVTAQGPIVGTFAVGDGSIIGPVGLTAVDLVTIRGIIKQWKSGRWKCARIVWELSGWTVGDGHSVGDSGLLVGGSHAYVGAV